TFIYCIANKCAREKVSEISFESGIIGYLETFSNGIFHPQPSLQAPFLYLLVHIYIGSIYIFIIDKMIRSCIGYPFILVQPLIIHHVISLHITRFYTRFKSTALFKGLRIIRFNRINIDVGRQMPFERQWIRTWMTGCIIKLRGKKHIGSVPVTDIIKINSYVTTCGIKQVPVVEIAAEIIKVNLVFRVRNHGGCSVVTCIGKSINRDRCRMTIKNEAA